MAKKEYVKEFKKHYKKAMRLKEGGKAWQREIDLAHHWLEIGKKENQAEWAAKYQY